MRVIFMGTPHFAVPTLTALIKSPKHEVVAVYTQPPRPSGRGLKLTPSPIQVLAEQHNIPVYIPTSLKDLGEQALFAHHQPDVAVVAAYGLLLPPPILTAPKFGCINIHPSDLPRWRGAAPLHRTILAGDTVTACCIMQMEAGLDTGPVLARTVYPIPDGTTTGKLHDDMAKLGAHMLLTVLDELEPGRAIATPQPETGVTYAAKITSAEQLVNWHQPAGIIRQQILGMAPQPGAMTSFHGQVVKIFNAHIESGNSQEKPGVTLDDRLLINAADGQALRLTELQRAGRQRQLAMDFLSGFAVAKGTVAQNP